MESAQEQAANGKYSQSCVYALGDVFARLDQIADEIELEENELKDFKETLMTRRSEFEQHRTECERRNRSIKSFANSLNEFLGDTK